MIPEYTPIFTNSKKEQELIIFNKIFKLLINDKNIGNIFDRNISYEHFLEISNLKTVMSHFGNNLNNSDFKIIIDNILKLVDTNKISNNNSTNNSFNQSYQKQLTARQGNSNIYRNNEEEYKLYE